ncbi:3693_t:CDS:2 [Funneliformis mosseae]|uniref:3693_t:CDS:1 n=1 Tax=Funneliformis mosseae TaxID=27381 RepID=A0A9N8YUS7_FUNMO|nr:3693_t:CDS:2 [Funneliformis mosseae]
MVVNSTIESLVIINAHVIPSTMLKFCSVPVKIIRISSVAKTLYVMTIPTDYYKVIGLVEERVFLEVCHDKVYQRKICRCTYSIRLTDYDAIFTLHT